MRLGYLVCVFGILASTATAHAQVNSDPAQAQADRMMAWARSNDQLKQDGWEFAGMSNTDRGGYEAMYYRLGPSSKYKALWVRQEYSIPVYGNPPERRILSILELIEFDCVSSDRITQQEQFALNNLRGDGETADFRDSQWDLIKPGSNADTYAKAACAVPEPAPAPVSSTSSPPPPPRRKAH